MAVDDHARIGFTDMHADEGKASAVQFLQNAVAYYRSLGVRAKKRVLTDIQSALREWAYGIPYNHSRERAAMLDRWIHHYNWHRPHQGIHGKAPISRLAKSENNLLTLHS